MWKEIRLPVCVGIGKTLTLAKVSNHISKKWPQFDGVCLIDNNHFKKKIFNQLSPIEVWGIGRKTNKNLQLCNILNVWQLSQLNLCLLPQGTSVELARTIKELNGESCKIWDGVRADILQIFSIISLGKRITNIENLYQALVKHISITALKAREQKLLCSTLIAFASNSPFDENPCSYKILKQLYNCNK